MGQNPDIRDLFRILYRPLCVYALHYLKDADAVEDVVQEAFTAWWQKGVGTDNAKAYLYAIVRNRCIDILRRRELLLMSKRDGLTYEQIADATGLSVNTVRNQISRALQSLRDGAASILDYILLLPCLPLA